MSEDDKKAWRYGFTILFFWSIGYAAGMVHETQPLLPWVFLLSWAAGNLMGWLATRE